MASYFAVRLSDLAADRVWLLAAEPLTDCITSQRCGSSKGTVRCKQHPSKHQTYWRLPFRLRVVESHSRLREKTYERGISRCGLPAKLYEQQCVLSSSSLPLRHGDENTSMSTCLTSNNILGRTKGITWSKSGFTGIGYKVGCVQA